MMKILKNNNADVQDNTKDAGVNESKDDNKKDSTLKQLEFLKILCRIISSV